MQEEHWKPLYRWMEAEYGLTLPSTEGFSAPPQSPEIASKLRSIVEEMDSWELAGGSKQKAAAHGSL